MNQSAIESVPGRAPLSPMQRRLSRPHKILRALRPDAVIVSEHCSLKIRIPKPLAFLFVNKYNVCVPDETLFNPGKQ